MKKEMVMKVARLVESDYQKGWSSVSVSRVMQRCGLPSDDAEECIDILHRAGVLFDRSVPTCIPNFILPGKPGEAQKKVGEYFKNLDGEP